MPTIQFVPTLQNNFWLFKFRDLGIEIKLWTYLRIHRSVFPSSASKLTLNFPIKKKKTSWIMTNPHYAFDDSEKPQGLRNSQGYGQVGLLRILFKLTLLLSGAHPVTGSLKWYYPILWPLATCEHGKCGSSELRCPINVKMEFQRQCHPQNRM